MIYTWPSMLAFKVSVINCSTQCTPFLSCIVNGHKLEVLWVQLKKAYIKQEIAKKIYWPTYWQHIGSLEFILVFLSLDIPATSKQCVWDVTRRVHNFCSTNTTEKIMFPLYRCAHVTNVAFANCDKLFWGWGNHISV